MYAVMIRIGNTGKMKRVAFEDPANALEYFETLCRRRTDYPATAVLTYRILIKKQYRLDKNWNGDRFIINEELTP